MALLDGFNVIPLKDKIGDLYLTITAKSLKFNRANARALDLPENIKILLNEKNNQLAIIPARADDENGIPFSFEEGSSYFLISCLLLWLLMFQNMQIKSLP